MCLFFDSKIVLSTVSIILALNIVVMPSLWKTTYGIGGIHCININFCPPSSNIFGNKVIISTDQGLEPRIATRDMKVASPADSPPGDRVYLVWEAYDGGDLDIFFRKSINGGKSFGSTINLSTGDRGFSADSQIAASGNNVYVVWHDISLGKDNIYFRRSTDGGNSFSAKIILSASIGGYSAGPTIAASGNNVYVTWQYMNDAIDNSEIYFRKSTDGGNNFDGTLNISNNDKLPFEQAMAISGNKIYLVWSDLNIDGSAASLSFRKSTDGGNNFDPVIALSQEGPTGFSPKLSAFENNLYLIYSPTTAGNDEIYFRKSTDGGNNFGAAIEVSNTAGDSQGARIAASANRIDIAWYDDTTGNFEVYYSNSKDGGNSFGAAPRLSFTQGDSYPVELAATGDKVYVLWVDDTEGPREIYFTLSTDGGVKFYGMYDLSKTSDDSFQPQIVATGKHVYVVWTDNTNDGILFKASPK